MDLLPAYLRGVNIQKHAAIMDAATKELWENNALLDTWLDIPRPLMIQRLALSPSQIRMTVHVHTRQVIKSIYISGEYKAEYMFDENDLVTDKDISFEIRGSVSENYYPVIHVVVDTYDEVTYRKSYPENQVFPRSIHGTRGATHDKDEFLDRIGRMLGLPRHIYKSYSFADAYLTSPPYCGEQVIEGAVPAYLEDDYDYQERLLEFIESSDTVSLPERMLRAIYGYKETSLVNANMISSDSLWSYLQENEVYIASQEAGGSYLLFVDDENPANIDDITDEEKTAFVERYIPVTRRAFILRQMETFLTLLQTHSLKNMVQKFTALLVDEHDAPIMDRDLEWILDGEATVMQTNGDGKVFAEFTEVPKGYHTLQVINHAGEGFSSSRDGMEYKSYLDQLTTYETEQNYGSNAQLTPMMNYEQSYGFRFKISGPRYILGVGYYDANGNRKVLFQGMEYAYGESTVMIDLNGGYSIDGEKTSITRYDWQPGDSIPAEKIFIFPIAIQGNVPSGRIDVSEMWLTHYNVYDNENILLDEFTIRCEVDIENGTTTYPVLLGDIFSGTRYGFDVDLMDYVLETGQHVLEYKFINYTAYLYVDGVYTGTFYDFEADTLTTGDVGESDETQTTAMTPYAYTRSPRVCFDTVDMQYLDITDHPGVPVQKGRFKPELTLVLVNHAAVYTANYAEDTLLLRATLHDEHGRPLTGELEITATGYDEEELDTINIINGSGEYSLPGLQVAGEITATVTSPERWMMKQNTAQLKIPVLASPLILDLKIISDAAELYISPSRDATLSATISIDTTATMGATLPLDGLAIEFYDGDTLITTEYTDENGTASIEYPIGTVIVNKTITAKYTCQTGEFTDAEDTAGFNTVQNNAKYKATYRNRVGLEEDVSFKVKATDQYGDPIPQTTVVAFNNERNISRAGRTDNNGEVTLIIPGQSTPGRFNIGVVASVANTYIHTAREYFTLQVQNIQIIASTSLSDINKSEITTNPLQFTVTVMEDNTAVSTGKIHVYQRHGTSRLFKKTITLSTAAPVTDSVAVNDYDEDEIILEFEYIRNSSLMTSTRVAIPVMDDTVYDPLDDEYFLDINNWGTTNSASGTPETAWGALTISTSNKTITDASTSLYYIYTAYSLQDFLEAHNNEFSVTAYKTGGDGRYELGFLDPTTGNKIAYQSGAVVCSANNTSVSGQEIEYQQYNEFTFKKTGTDLHVYFKRKSNYGYADVTIPLGSIDLTAYKLYMKSSVRDGLTITNDDTKIQNHSRNS